MSFGLSAKHLDVLDETIDKYELHACSVVPTVSIDTALGDITLCYAPLPRGVYAMAARWYRGRDLFEDISLNSKLHELTESAWRRYAVAHELAHMLLNHQGDFFYLWRAAGGLDPFQSFIERSQERQSDQAAAYLLIPKEHILDCRRDEHWRVAAGCDVPEHLVPVRWEVYKKFNR
jgi:hypothetical protein